MGVAGHDIIPYPVFRAALDVGDLGRIRHLAAQMPRVELRDALRICLLMRDHDDYERAAIRWLGRLALETGDVDLTLLQEAAAALDALPHQPDTAMEQLASVCARCGIA